MSIHAKDVAKNVTVSIRFGDAYCYEFGVEIPLVIPNDETFDLEGINSTGEKFKLGGLGNLAVRILRKFGHASRKAVADNYGNATVFWELHPVPKKGRPLTTFAKLKPVRKIVRRSNVVAQPGPGSTLPAGKLPSGDERIAT
jgi:hypothetical protein